MGKVSSALRAATYAASGIIAVGVFEARFISKLAEVVPNEWVDWIESPWLLAGLVGFFLGWLWDRAVQIIERIEARRAGVPKVFLSAFGPAHASGIGLPVEKPRKVTLAQWFEHELAAVLWIRDDGRIYQLRKGGGEKRVSLFQDHGVDKKFHDPEQVRQMLNLQDGFNPPKGGIASAWLHEPEAWSWIGQHLSSIVLSHGVLTMQRFDNGLMVGPIPLRRGDPSKFTVWIVYDGHWGYELVRSKGG